MNREQKAIKDILAEWQDFDKNLFYQSVLLALQREEYKKLQELGSATHYGESELRFIQGEYSTLKKMRTFADKHKEDLMSQL